MHNGCAPAAEVFIRQMELRHVGMLLKSLNTVSRNCRCLCRG